ncbi:2-nitropropane dioxygenase [Reticulomyxa filosa]|uniref:2-nitropropane dioxygenase n=1 Tax=Reticulomyxa filosa TaxID=46433 RepID=X6NM45_RETFI|nr:2-nitropropane dioxygenase [Reticulomyxa filosa]|eukprot:ETO26983.1 2-nitropropane dioxygenase [Reticulomyxa filosa]
MKHVKPDTPVHMQALTGSARKDGKNGSFSKKKTLFLIDFVINRVKMSRKETITTPLTKLLGIECPIILAGMNKAAGPELAAVISNCGGLGVIGGVLMSPRILKTAISVLKKNLDEDKKSNFGVDLLIPQVGGSARKTNKDYTEGQLEELVDVIIESKAKLFVCAVGVPPKWVVEKFHKNNILCANMVGHPKHVDKACVQGVDIIIAQGEQKKRGRGGGKKNFFFFWNRKFYFFLFFFPSKKIRKKKEK